MDKTNEDKGLEFDSPKEGLKYSMNSEGLSIQLSLGETNVLWKGEVLEMLSALTDFVKRYGLRDNYGREVNADLFFWRLWESISVPSAPPKIPQ